MKIDNRSSVTFDPQKNIEKKVNIPDTKIDSQLNTDSSSDDLKLSQTLKSALENIQNSGMTAGELHSNVDPHRAAGLLHSIEVDAKQPRLPEEDILKLADKTSAAIKASPEAALAAFSPLDGKRVSELISD